MPNIAARSFALMCLTSAALLCSRPAHASWPASPLVNVPVSTATGDQMFARLIADGAGGVIVTWFDYRGGSTADIYAQRVSSTGVPMWLADGVPVCTASGNQTYPTLAPDGAGGAFITWNDLRSGLKIYGQHLGSDGTPQWAGDGIPLCTNAAGQQNPWVVADGTGGALVTWLDSRNGWYAVCAQRVTAGGAFAWPADGVVLCDTTGYRYEPHLVSDGAGGAIVTWYDQRSGGNYTFDDVYARRVSAAGVPQWTAQGVRLCTATGSQQTPVLVSDGLGGAIVTWFDGRASDFDIYAQRISGAGIAQWTGDGVALCTAAGEQAYPSLVADGVGGAIVAWRDYRSGAEYDTYAQRISQAGSPQWTPNGVVVCNATGDQYDPAIVTDGSGGALVAWPDGRSGPLDMYAQRLSGAGVAQWAPNGVALCTAAGMQNVVALVADGAGGAIAAWQDMRSGALDIFAQRIQGSGVLGGNVTDVPVRSDAAFGLSPAYPNPATGGTLSVQFTLPDARAATLELFDLAGRRILARDVGLLGAGAHSVTLGAGRRLAPGVYLVRLAQGGRSATVRVAIIG